MKHTTTTLLFLGLLGCGDPDNLRPDNLEGAEQPVTGAAFLGARSCPPGSPSCNNCVNDLRATLDAGFDGAFHWDAKPWRFNWTRDYPPTGRSPSSAFQDDSLIPDHHVQGFVRTNSSRVRFMMTHSDESAGSIARIVQLSDGRKQLDTLVRSTIAHPSGGQVLGGYFAFAEHNSLRVLDVDGPATDLRQTFPRTDSLRTGGDGAGGGLGAVRLSDGRTMIVVSTPGGDGSATRRTLFYVKDGDIAEPAPLRLVGETPYAQPAGWNGDYQRSENLSVLTECSTGKIYTLHATGEVDGVRAYFRLSRVDTTADGQARLTTIKAYNTTQNIFNCHLRSSGTAFATPTHRLELYCHQWATKRFLFDSTGEFYFNVGD